MTKQNMMEAIVPQWKKFGTTKALPRAVCIGQTEQSGEKGLGQGDGHSDRALEFLQRFFGDR
jgi:hypothetical protein